MRPLTLTSHLSTSYVLSYDLIVIKSLGCRVGGEVSDLTPKEKEEEVVADNKLETVIV